MLLVIIEVGWGKYVFVAFHYNFSGIFSLQYDYVVALFISYKMRKI